MWGRPDSDSISMRLALKAGFIAVGILLLGATFFLFASAGLPEAAPSLESAKVFDRNGRLLYEVPVSDEGSHTGLALSDISSFLKQATIATEDSSFYQNPGVDVFALGRALLQNLRGGEVVSGGSTITQQLVRSLYFTPQERSSRSLLRKLRETVLAFRLARELEKDRILELYLNRVYYGNLAYGVEAAARTYFGKSAQDLDLAEASLLAGLPQAPSRYDLFSHLEAAKERQATVLSLMKKAGYIDEVEAKAAREEPVQLGKAPFPIRAPHFVAYVRQWLEEKLGSEAMAQGGLRVYTTLDLDMQITAENMLVRHLSNLRENDASNAALVALDVATGQVLAMVGSPDYFDASIDGAVNMATAPRQPGSAVKPITYALALSKGYSAATPLLDVPTTLLTRRNQPYVPNNYDAIFRGPVSLRYALGSSFNVPAVRVMQDVGVDAFLRLASDLGITTLGDADRYDLSVTLGGGEVSLLELTGAYAAFAAGGERRESSPVLRVEDAQGRTLHRWQGGPGRRVVSPQVAYLITDMLADNNARAPAFGLNSPLRLSRPASGKTGTTGDFRDNWTVGYTPDIAVGVWMGNADNSAMRQVSGISGAAPLWHDFMEEVLKTNAPKEFARPPGLVEAEICEPTGLKPGDWCPERRMELFIAGTEPAGTETYYRPLPVRDGGTAPRDPERVYTFVPEEAIPWARAAGLPLPPLVEYSAAVDHNDRADVGFWVSLVSPGPEMQLAVSREIPLDSQRVIVEAVAGGDPERIEIYADGDLLAVRREAPFSAAWRLSPGEHRFRAVAYDRTGRRVESKVVRVMVMR
ncbi:MAG: penicillin-binding protein 1C [Chloroflexi bacterium]|nr:penicillin-binding protein 1C [Chloroflexota bacterium]